MSWARHLRTAAVRLRSECALERADDLMPFHRRHTRRGVADERLEETAHLYARYISRLKSRLKSRRAQQAELLLLGWSQPLKQLGLAATTAATIRSLTQDALMLRSCGDNISSVSKTTPTAIDAACAPGRPFATSSRRRPSDQVGTRQPTGSSTSSHREYAPVVVIPYVARYVWLLPLF